jgi:hypothetical protein
LIRFGTAAAWAGQVKKPVPMPLSGFISVTYFASRLVTAAIQDGVSASIRNLAM